MNSVYNLSTLQGIALGLCPRDKLFRGYIDLEIQLREFERSRILYEKYLEFGPENCVTWIRVSNLFCSHKLCILQYGNLPLMTTQNNNFCFFVL